MRTIKLEEYNNIFAYDVFLAELRELYHRSPRDAEQYQRWLDRQLHLIDTKAILSLLDRSDVFEKLNCSGLNLYCIRKVPFPGNPRVIFADIVEGDERTVVLIAAFKERKKADYRRAIELSKARFDM